MSSISGYDPSLDAINLYGVAYPLSKLDNLEQSIFDQQFTSLVGADSSVLRELMEDRRSIIINSIRAVKYFLEGPNFRGLQASDAELGFSFIRPTHVKVSGTQLTVWGTSVTTSWADWLGSASSGVGFAMSANQGMVIIGFKSLTTPQPYLSEINIKIGRIQLVPEDIRDIQLFDNKNQIPYFPIPTILAMPRDTLLIRIRGDVAGTDQIVPVGFTIALGRFLKDETATFIT